MISQAAIVIPTYNRYEQLMRAVGSAVAEAPGFCEVIVVDQSEDRAERARQLTKAFPSVRHVELARPGLTRARNAGIEASQAEVVLFMDDDAVMKSGCVEEHVRVHELPGVGAVGGRVRQMGEEQWSDAAIVASIDPATGVATGNFDLDREGPVPYVAGGNLSVKRSALNVAGMFNERFRGNALFEEVEFLVRLRRHGYAVRYAPRAEIEHRPPGTGGCHSGDERSYMLDRIYNHTLYYFLSVRRTPSLAFLEYIKGIAEFASRRTGGGHRMTIVAACARAMVSAYVGGLASLAGSSGRRYRVRGRQRGRL